MASTPYSENDPNLYGGDCQNVCILGATGSIGLSTLDVISLHPMRYRVFALTAYANHADMLNLCQLHRPEIVVMVDDNAAQELKEKLHSKGLHTIQVLSGKQGLIDIAEATTNDTVMASIVGASGLLPTMAAVKSGKRVLLANKEALVTSGALFIDAVEKYGLAGLTSLKKSDILKRIKQYEKMVIF